MNNELVAHVKAVNMANAYANVLYPELVAALEPFMGKQVLKADGTLLKRVVDALPELRRGDGYTVFHSQSSYALSWYIKTCVNIEDTYACVYHEIGLYIGNLQGGVLTSWVEPCGRRSDYTPEEVEAKRALCREAERAYHDARSELSPFGEH